MKFRPLLLSLFASVSLHSLSAHNFILTDNLGGANNEFCSSSTTGEFDNDVVNSTLVQPPGPFAFFTNDGVSCVVDASGLLGATYNLNGVLDYGGAILPLPDRSEFTFPLGANPTLTLSSIDNIGGTGCTTEYEAVFTLNPDNSNSPTEYRIQFSITDNTAPVITGPAAATVVCGGDFTPSALGTATATDNCEPNGGTTPPVVTGEPFINEFHYDNSGADQDEFIEIAGPKGLDLAQYSIELSSAHDGSVYTTQSLSGVIAEDRDGMGAIVFQFSRITNGPDGIALCGPTGLIEFISYEGTYTATDGCANGITSDDIGLIENGSTQIGESLQRTGTGSASSDFSWVGPVASSPGALNANQTIQTTPTATTDGGGGDISTITYADVVVSGTAGNCPRTIERTWTATDACGNTSTAVQTITVEDSAAPTFGGTGESVDLTTTQIEAAGYGNCYGSFDIDRLRSRTAVAIARGRDNVSGLFNLPVATDGSGATPSLSVVSIERVGNALSPCTGELAAVFTASDAAGNVSDEYTITIKISDDEAPELSSTLDSTVSICSSELATYEGVTPTFVDNCVQSNTSAAQEVGPSVWINEIHYDNMGRDVGEAIEIAGIGGVDISGYTIVLYNGSVATTYGNTYTLSGTLGSANSISAVSVATPGLQNRGPDGIVLVDAAGGIVEFISYGGSFTAIGGPADGLTSVDIPVDEFNATTPIGNSLQKVGQGRQGSDFVWVAERTSSFGSVNDGQSYGQAPGVEVTISDSSPTASTTCPNGQEITRTFTATDGCGNSSTVTQTIVLKDDRLKFSSTPNDTTLQCGDITISPDASGNYSNADLTSLANSSFGTVNVLGGCGVDSAATFTDVINQNPTGTNEVATLTRTYRAVDNPCGTNLSALRVTLTIQDSQAPVVTNSPQDITVECDETAANYTPAYTDCSTVTVTTSDQDLSSNSNNPQVISVVRRTYTLTDASGNTSTVQRQVTIRDTKGPVVTNTPSDVTIECDETAPTYTPEYKDCSSNVTITETDEDLTSTSTDSKVVSLIRRTYTLTDGSGNTSTVQRQVTIRDTKGPVVTNTPSDVTIECDEAVPTYTPTYTDCSSNVTVSETDEDISNTSTDPQVVSITRYTYTLTDGNGNKTSVQRDVIIRDTEGPVVTNTPQDVAIECDETAPTYTPEYTDCSSNVTVVSTDEDITNTSSDPQVVSIIRRTYTLTDEGGNTSTVQRVVTTSDTQAPVVTNSPSDVTIDCADAVPTYTPQYTDCSASVTVTETVDDITNTSSDPQVVSVTRRTYTLTDEGGNSSSVQQEITIRDTEAPVLADAEVTFNPYEEDANGVSAVDFQLPTFSDNCGAVTVTSSVNPGDELPIGITTVEVVATDAVGNFTTYYFNIEVIPSDYIEIASTHMNISVANSGDLGNASINFPYVVTKCDATPQGEAISGHSYLGYFQGSHYYISNNYHDWAIANQTARELGGKLASISDARENRFLMDHLPVSSAWLGLESFGRHDQQFRWEDGSNYSNWAAGNPVTDFYNVFGYIDAATGELKNDDLSLRPYIVEFKPFQFWSQPFSGTDELSYGLNTRVIKVMDACGNVDFAVQQINVTDEPVNYCNPKDIAGEYTLTSAIDGYYISAVQVEDDEQQFSNYASLVSADTMHLEVDGPSALAIELGNNNRSVNNDLAYYRAWIDYNNDGDFYDSGELVYETSGKPNASDLANLGETNGYARMRVAASRYTYPEACGINPLGATQDIIVEVTKPAGSKELILGARALGTSVYLTTEFIEDASVDRYVLLRGTTASNLSKLQVWNANYKDGKRSQYTQVDQSPLSIGFYQVYAVSADGQIIDKSEVISAKLKTTRGSITSYPNPASEKVALEIKGNASKFDGLVEVIDAFGRMVTKVDWPAGEQVIDLALPQVASGTYYLRVVHPDAPVQTLSILIDQEMGDLLRP